MLNIFHCFISAEEMKDTNNNNEFIQYRRRNVNENRNQLIEENESNMSLKEMVSKMNQLGNMMSTLTE